MKRIAGYLMIVCLVGGGCLGLPLSAKGEENPPEHPVVGQEWHDPVSGIDFVWVPEGCFQMGQTKADKRYIIQEQGEKNYKKYYVDELPRHEVCVDGFWMGKTEITQAQWRRIMKNNPSGFKRFHASQGDTHPVEQVS